jgi:F-type H+-transporting ATPase subunit epsilon
MKTLHADIVTPDRKVFSGEIQSIQLPGSEGSFEILFNHAPIVATLETGKIRIKTADGKIELIKGVGGVVEVSKNQVSVLLEKAESL